MMPTNSSKPAAAFRKSTKLSWHIAVTHAPYLHNAVGGVDPRGNPTMIRAAQSPSAP